MSIYLSSYSQIDRENQQTSHQPGHARIAIETRIIVISLLCIKIDCRVVYDGGNISSYHFFFDMHDEKKFKTFKNLFELLFEPQLTSKIPSKGPIRLFYYFSIIGRM